MVLTKIINFLYGKSRNIAGQLALEHALYRNKLTNFLHDTIGHRGLEKARFAFLFVGAIFLGISIASASLQQFG